MRYLFLFVFISLFIGNSCKSDTADKVEAEPLDMKALEEDLQTDEAVEVEVKMDEAIEQTDLAKKIIKGEEDKEVAEKAQVEDRNETKLVGKSEEQKKKEAQMKLAATKDIIDKSENKGLSCEEMYKSQSKLIDEFEKSGDRKIIIDLAKKQNDPFFKECLEVEEFRQKIDDLALRLEGIMDSQ